MKYSQRVKLADKYRQWMSEENKKHPFDLVDNPETFLAFLSMKGLLKEISPEYELMNAREDCEDYHREGNFTCDMSDLCASCKHSREVQGIKRLMEGKKRLFSILEPHIGEIVYQNMGNGRYDKVKILDGEFLDSKYKRLSNWWKFENLETGEIIEDHGDFYREEEENESE